MPNRAHSLTLWLWMAALLSSTMGISVQQIYCYCVGKTTYTFFRNAPDACAVLQKPATGACCRKAAPRCCANAAVKKQAGERSCTKKTVKVFQLKTAFLLGHPLDKTLEYPTWADAPTDYLRWYNGVLYTTRCTNKAPPTPPPPLPGRIICLRHALFRC